MEGTNSEHNKKYIQEENEDTLQVSKKKSLCEGIISTFLMTEIDVYRPPLEFFPSENIT